MTSRLVGVLLVLGGLAGLGLGVMAATGAAVGLGGESPNRGLVLVALLLLSVGFMLGVRNGPAGRDEGLGRVGGIGLAVGFGAIAVSSVLPESVAGLGVVAGLVLAGAGGVVLGIALARRIGVLRWVGLGLIAGIALTVLGTLVPQGYQAIAIAGLFLAVASVMVLGATALRPMESGSEA